ncbi:MAG: hypothetical protein JXA93_19520 [Anaerolineae bacterium]|nr:hypothetical protein [Anaerolineae bacterium]
MIELIKRLLSPEYLVVTDPGPLGGAWVLYALLGVLFGAGLVAAVWVLAGPGRSSQSAARRAWSWFEGWVCAVGLLVVVARVLAWPGWSARIWPFSLAGLAIAGTVVYWLRGVQVPAWLQIPPSPPTPLPQGRRTAVLLGLGAHLLGIAFVISARYGWPLWAAPLLLGVILVPQLPLLVRTGQIRLAALAPLLLAYAATLLWTAYLALGITVRPWQGLIFPDPMTSLFYVDGMVLAAVTYSLLSQLYVTCRMAGRPAAFWKGTVAALMAVTLIWAGIVYFGKRTHGATASDPYAYAQMGVDLAERGTFVHRFSLFQEVIPLDIAWAPLQPVGYHIPRNDLGDCPSVWATGASALLGAGYALLGEVGLYVTTPMVALLALAATWALVFEVLRDRAAPVRYLTAALAVALLATSPEHVDRLLVPMADAAAQLFTVLMLLFVLRGSRHLAAGRLAAIDWLLAGLTFAWAYWVRHTQLVLVAAVVVGILAGWKIGRLANRPIFRPARLSILALGLFGIAALAGAAPDILYRVRWFGGLFATETTELPLMALRHVGPVAAEMARAALAAGEWGYLFPLALYGAWRLLRDRQWQAAIVGSAFVAVLGVHLTYQALRLRDLISIFPLVDLAIAYGAVSLVRCVWEMVRGKPCPGSAPSFGSALRLGTALLPAVTVGWIVLSVALSRWAMIDNMWRPGWASFGYMRAVHRAAFDELAALTPPNAVIGASLNAGAVMMYTGREAIRPYDSWTGEEWDIFLAAMEKQDRPIYLLDDGGLMARFIEAQAENRALTPVAELQVPLFYTRDRETGWLYRLEER